MRLGCTASGAATDWVEYATSTAKDFGSRVPCFPAPPGSDRYPPGSDRYPPGSGQIGIPPRRIAAFVAHGLSRRQRSDKSFARPGNLRRFTSRESPPARTLTRVRVSPDVQERPFSQDAPRPRAWLSRQGIIWANSVS